MNLRNLLKIVLMGLQSRPYNDEQIKHLAITLRLVGFAILGAIGWPSFQALSLLGVVFTICAFVLFQYLAFVILEDIKK